MTSLADCLSFWFSVDSPMGKLIPMTQKLRDARKKIRKKSCRGRQRLTQTQSVVNFDKNQTAGNKYFVKKTMFQSFILTDNLITPVVSCFFFLKSDSVSAIGIRKASQIPLTMEKMYRNKGLPHLQDTYSKWPKGGAVLSVSNETLKKR